MRALWLQAGALVAGVALAAPRPDPEGQPAETAKPAGASPVESADVPAWQPSPARFAVTPLENHTTGKTLDWIVAEAPFEIAEKTEGLLGLEPAGGSLYVGGTQIPADEPSVAAFGAQQHVPWVITGWFDKPSATELRIDLILWRVEKGTAKLAAQAQKSGDPKTYHQMLGAALGEIWAKVGVTTPTPERLQRALSNDYAVFLFGHGLAHPDRRGRDRGSQARRARARALGDHGSQALRGAARARRDVRGDRARRSEGGREGRGQAQLRERPRAR